MPKCKVCEKGIRGNAAKESYNETTQMMEFVCKACDKLFNPTLHLFYAAMPNGMAKGWCGTVVADNAAFIIKGNDGRTGWQATCKRCLKSLNKASNRSENEGY